MTVLFCLFKISDMPNDETLNDRAISTMMEIQKSKDAIRQYNDYGDTTGFRDEYDQLHNDAWAILGSLRARASRLQLRASRYERDLAAAKSGQNAERIHGGTGDGKPRDASPPLDDAAC